MTPYRSVLFVAVMFFTELKTAHYLPGLSIPNTTALIIEF
jgi:hypothetical protein